MVTRIHGQFARVLMSTTTTGSFSVLGSISEATIDRSTARADTSSMGDTIQTSVQGLPKGDIDFKGFYDLDDTVLKAARLLTTGAMIGIYPNYDADKTKYYAVLADVEFSYVTAIDKSQTINGKAYARRSPVDNL